MLNYRIRHGCAFTPTKATILLGRDSAHSDQISKHATNICLVIRLKMSEVILQKLIRAAFVFQKQFLFYIEVVLNTHLD